MDKFFEGGAKDFRDKLVKYSIGLGFKFVYLKTEKFRVNAECIKKTSEVRKWRVHESVSLCNEFFYMLTLNNVDSCSGLIHTHKSSKMGSKIVSTILVNRIKDNSFVKSIEVVKEFK